MSSPTLPFLSDSALQELGSHAYGEVYKGLKALFEANGINVKEALSVHKDAFVNAERRVLEEVMRWHRM